MDKGCATHDRALGLLMRHKQTVLHWMYVSCTSAQTAEKQLTVVEKQGGHALSKGRDCKQM